MIKPDKNHDNKISDSAYCSMNLIPEFHIKTKLLSFGPAGENCWWPGQCAPANGSKPDRERSARDDKGSRARHLSSADGGTGSGFCEIVLN